MLADVSEQSQYNGIKVAARSYSRLEEDSSTFACEAVVLWD